MLNQTVLCAHTLSNIFNSIVPNFNHKFISDIVKMTILRAVNVTMQFLLLALARIIEKNTLHYFHVFVAIVPQLFNTDLFFSRRERSLACCGDYVHTKL